MPLSGRHDDRAVERAPQAEIPEHVVGEPLELVSVGASAGDAAYLTDEMRDESERIGNHREPPVAAVGDAVE